jgi:hypothetical protein
LPFISMSYLKFIITWQLNVDKLFACPPCLKRLCMLIVSVCAAIKTLATLGFEIFAVL